jgi:1,4-dihydroxy-2-naphthoate octaprenyltransferase
MSTQTILMSMRLPFLLLALVCVFLAYSFAKLQGVEVSILSLSLAIIGSLSAHISVNTFNEYFDFKSGLDFNTQKTPFSGGSGALPASPNMAEKVLLTAIISLLSVIAIGLYFLWQSGLALLPLGLSGIVLILVYTQWINKQPWLCLIAPGTGFGLLMVVGCYYVFVGYYHPSIWLTAIIPFFLVNNLLLLNQYPDIDADKAAGRYHFPIAYGIKHSNIIYGLFIIGASATIILGVLNDVFPLLSLIALMPLALMLFALNGAIQHGKHIGQYPHFLGMNVAANLLVPLLLGISFLIG